jgi:hypothetical protein
MPTSRRKRFALSLAGALAALGAAELGLRWLAPDLTPLLRLFETTGDPRPYVLRPGAAVEYTGVTSRLPHPVRWDVNAQGLREDRSIDAPSERFRVVAYGDSEAFGWSVAQDETFQRRMEALDRRVEVLNLGVPGYNVADTREHLERTLGAFDPDLAIFLSTKNDFDRSLELGTVWSGARLLMWARLAQRVVVERPARRALRRSPERKRFFAGEIERMVRFCEARGVPLIIGFERSQNRRDLLDHRPPGGWLATHPDGRGAGGFRLELVDVDEWIRGIPDVDGHLSAPAHRELAALLCRRIAGPAADGGCVPPGWARPAARRPTRESADAQRAEGERGRASAELGA